MASLTEESLSKVSKQELIAIMLKMQNKMDPQIRSWLRRYVNLMKVFNNFSATFHKFDIVCLSETTFDPSVPLHDANLEIQGYELV